MSALKRLESEFDGSCYSTNPRERENIMRGINELRKKLLIERSDNNLIITNSRGTSTISGIYNANHELTKALPGCCECNSR